jgi:ubiquitin-protein ligase
MSRARDLRLLADYEHLRALAEGSGGTLTIESAQGRPPDQYVLVYRCRSIEKLIGEKPVYRDLHRVRIKLPANYPAPSAPPVVDLLTPIFHPHVFANLSVCMGSWETTEYLEDFALRLGALLQYDRRYLNIKDPANEQAMYWVSRNLALLPTDNRTFSSEPASQETADVEGENQRLWHEWLDLDPEQERYA